MSRNAAASRRESECQGRLKKISFGYNDTGHIQAKSLLNLYYYLAVAGAIELTEVDGLPGAQD